MNPLAYSKSIPPHVRVGQFLADEARLGWVFKFLRHVPRAEAYIVGGTARDAVKGVLPKGLHVVIRNVPLDDIDTLLQKLGTTSKQDDSKLFFKPDNFKTDEAIEISIPHDDGPEPYAPLVYDLGKRDFSINAMAYSLNSGFIIDPFGGVRDLHNRTLRTVGRPSSRFAERPRRTLRALRIASEHQYKIDDGTWHSLKELLPRLNKIIINDDGAAVFETPRVHIGHEFLRLLAGHPKYGYKLWQDSGAEEIFTPELKRLQDIQHRGGDSGAMRVERLLEDLGQPMPSLVFAGILSHLEDTAVTSAKDIIVRLHLHAAHPHFNHANVLWMLEHRNLLEDVDPAHMSASSFENVFGKERGQHLLTFLHATHRASGRHTRTRDHLHQATKRRRELVTDIKKPQILRGRDLESLGVTPGPHFRKILAKIRDAQLDGHVDNRDEALNYARNLIAARVF